MLAGRIKLFKIDTGFEQLRLKNVHVEVTFYVNSLCELKLIT